MLDLHAFFHFRGNNAKTPEYFEDLFCNLGCYEEYRLRTSGRFLREVNFKCFTVLKWSFLSSYCLCNFHVEILMCFPALVIKPMHGHIIYILDISRNYFK